ncbi:Uncharacterised protein [Mycobacteroides abscessus subsp. abscessus]|nr:Uncharacterised protein [Mycobacteroides abscessus subsp. abscessus]
MPLGRVVDSPGRRFTLASLASLPCRTSSWSSANNDCGLPVSRPVSPR